MTDFGDLMQELLGTLGTTPAPEGNSPREAKPTMYAGTLFRSALEASWAATMISLGIRWEYEPETITLPSGAMYIPDFKLPEIGAWLEVKGENVPRIEKAIELGQTLACACKPVTNCQCRWRGGKIVVIGHPPRVRWNPDTHRTGWWANWSGAHGSNPWITRCRSCNVAGFTTSAWCRACDQMLGGHLTGPADFEIRMGRL